MYGSVWIFRAMWNEIVSFKYHWRQYLEARAWKTSRAHHEHYTFINSIHSKHFFTGTTILASTNHPHSYDFNINYVETKFKQNISHGDEIISVQIKMVAQLLDPTLQMNSRVFKIWKSCGPFNCSIYSKCKYCKFIPDPNTDLLN